MIMALVVVVIDVVCVGNYLRVIYPKGDEFALIAMSKEHPWQWIREGYSEAFKVYPEYFKPYTNFIRPTATLLYRVFSFVPHPHLSQIIAVNYVVHALLCALLYIFSIRFQNSQRFSVIVVVTAFFAPAFWNTPMLINPSFALDGLAALLCLSSFLCIVRGQTFLAFGFLLLGVLTKETALPIAAALLLSGVLFRQGRLLIVSCLVLLIWFGLRFYAFGTVLGGTYSFTDMPLQAFLTRVSVIALLPVSYINLGDIKDLVVSRNNYATLLFLIGNGTIWLLTLLLVVKGKYVQQVTALFSREAVALNATGYSIITLICLGASVAFLALVGGQVRFSYVSFVFWLMLISTIKNQRSLKYVASLVLLTLLAIGYFLRLPEVVNVSDMHVYQYAGARAHVNFLANSEISDGTYVFGEYLSLYSKQDNLAIMAGLNVTLSRGSSIDINACSIADARKVVTRVVQQEPNVKRLETVIPACAEFSFYGANRELLTQNLQGQVLKRNEAITYRFGDIKVASKGRSKFQQITSFGKTMEATVVGRPILYFDFTTGEWIYLP